MEFWEFLLQKEGDRSWLPLESPNVEILEGRYRVVARSSRPNTILEIKVTQQDLDEMPPVRHIQKRSGKTNPQGLVVIMPFTRLQPGDLELRCTGDLMDDMLGNGWSQTVQLQVLPVEPDSDWQDNDFTETNLTGIESTAYLDSPLETNNAFEATKSPSLLDKIPEIPIEDSPAFAQVFEPVTPQEPQSEEPQPIESESVETQLVKAVDSNSSAESNSLAEIHSLCLLLSQDTWVIQRNQSLTLTGTIATLEESSGSSPLQLGQLRIRLFDPQNSQMLFEQHYPIQENQSLPIPFACELSLPADSAYLVLGELALYGIAQPGELPLVLATQSFNVSTELHELLEAIANNFPNPDLVLPPQATVSKEAQLAEIDPSFFNIPPVTQTLLRFQSSEQNFLPPQLHPTPANNPAKVHRLDLPSFTVSNVVNGDRTAANLEENTEPQEILVLDAAVIAEIVANISNPEKAEAADLANHADAKTSAEASPVLETAIAPAVEVTPAVEVVPAVEKQAPIERVDELIGDWDEDWEIAVDGTLNWRQVQKKEPVSTEDRAFQSLNLQNRFLNRLQTLATDPEISDWLREPTVSIPPNPIDQEIVVDDDQLPPTRTNPIFNFSQASEPVPMPQVEVPPGELVAGQPINVTVRLPKSTARIYAKLWVRDRQLKILIESPRWLVDFKPDGFGALKAQTMVTLPLGCMEVQFEAIAIEMSSQSESQRAIVCCSVISPELSALSIEELDV